MPVARGETFQAVTDQQVTEWVTLLPVTGEATIQPVTGGYTSKPVTIEDTSTPVTIEEASTPVTGDDTSKPVTRGIDFPASHWRGDFLASNGRIHIPVSHWGKDFPASDWRGDFPTSHRGETSLPITGEYTSRSVTQQKRLPNKSLYIRLPSHSLEGHFASFPGQERKRRQLSKTIGEKNKCEL